MEEYLNTNTNTNTNVPHVRFLAFRNVMAPMNNIQHFQNDYNNTDVKVELVDEQEEIQLLDNSYETNIVKNTVDTVNQVHNAKIQDQQIIKDNTGK